MKLSANRAIWAALAAVLVVAVIWSGVRDSSSTGPSEDAQRVEQLSSEIMCPTCQGLSVADSSSPLARSSADEIERLVSDGQSDEQIRDYFVSRYGEEALMNPERRGSAWLLWVLPAAFVVLAIGGAFLALRRWRSNPEQFAEPSADKSPDVVSAPLPSTPSGIGRSGTQITVGVLVAVLVLGGIGAALTADNRGTNDEITGNSERSTTELLALAGQLTAQNQAVEAVQTYDEVLEREPDNVIALAYRGWLVRLAGLTDEGLQSIDRAIELDPAYPDARFFKGYILLQDRDDPAGAVAEFEAFLANDPPEQTRALVEDALADARSRLD